MKNLFSILFALALFGSCQKEPCNVGTIEITNMGDVAATVYSIPSHPVLQPGESINQEVEFCTGYDVNGSECGNAVQTAISFQFEDSEMEGMGAIVSRCETTLVEISN